MNELIPINYDGDTPKVSGRELHNYLESALSFQELFIRVCEIKLNCDAAGLRALRNALCPQIFRYGSTAIAYLADTIDMEKVYAMECERNRLKKPDSSKH